MSTFYEILRKSLLEDSSNWEQQQYYLIHKSGLQIWTSNGFWWFDTYPNSNAFTFIDKLKFISLKRKWVALKTSQKLR